MRGIRRMGIVGELKDGVWEGLEGWVCRGMGVGWIGRNGWNRMGEG